MLKNKKLNAKQTGKVNGGAIVNFSDTPINYNATYVIFDDKTGEYIGKADTKKEAIKIAKENGVETKEYTYDEWSKAMPN